MSKSRRAFKDLMTHNVSELKKFLKSEISDLTYEENEKYRDQYEEYIDLSGKKNCVEKTKTSEIFKTSRDQMNYIIDHMTKKELCKFMVDNKFLLSPKRHLLIHDGGHINIPEATVITTSPAEVKRSLTEVERDTVADVIIINHSDVPVETRKNANCIVM